MLRPGPDSGPAVSCPSPSLSRPACCTGRMVAIQLLYLFAQWSFPAQRSFHRLCSRRSSTSSFRELCPSFFLKNPGSQRSAIQLNYQNHNFLCFSLGCVDELSHLFASLPAFHSLILSFSLPRRLPSSNRCCSFELNILSYLSIYSSRLISLPGRSILASSATAVRSPSATRCASNASTAPISIFAGLAR